MQKDEMTRVHELIQTSHKNICQIAALKNGKTVYEDYWNGFQQHDALNAASVTKSVVSLLIGIAIDKGLIESVDQYVLDFFPDYKIKRGEKTIKQVTLRHLLTMTAPYKYRSEPWTRVCSSADWTTAALDLLGGRAGITGQFRYSTLGLQILTGIIAHAGVKNVIDFANKYLFEPLGAARHSSIYLKSAEEHMDFILSQKPKENVWLSDPMGVPMAGSGLCLSACDMVKIGQLCLENGSYNGRQIVSSQWIKEITQPRFQCGESFGNMEYGYLWWIIDEKDHIYAAIGDGGNVIYVNPSKNTVVAVTSTFKPRVLDRIEMIKQHIEPLL